MGFCRFFLLFIITILSIQAGASSSFDLSIKKLRALATRHKINLRAFDQTFTYLKLNAAQIENKNYVTIIDYNRPSKEKRLFIFDLRQLKIFSLFVAHGRASGLKESKSFSNKVNSFKSSLGFIKTGEPYQSREVGLALQLHGLEPRNDLAFKRGIVIHGAWYVGPTHIKRHGRLGRSLGCPAVERRLIGWVINKLKGGSLIYSFHS